MVDRLFALRRESERMRETERVQILPQVVNSVRRPKAEGHRLVGAPDEDLNKGWLPHGKDCRRAEATDAVLADEPPTMPVRAKAASDSGRTQGERLPRYSVC